MAGLKQKSLFVWVTLKQIGWAAAESSMSGWRSSAGKVF